MRVVNKHASEPEEVEVTQHQPDDNLPLDLDGVIVMPGDYYHDGEHGKFAIAAADIGDMGSWQPVK